MTKENEVPNTSPVNPVVGAKAILLMSSFDMLNSIPEPGYDKQFVVVWVYNGHAWTDTYLWSTGTDDEGCHTLLIYDNARDAFVDDSVGLEGTAWGRSDKPAPHMIYVAK